MPYLCHSTRHTKAGTFRHGVVYEPDMKDPVVSKAVRNLSAGEEPVLEKISKEAAKKHQVKPFRMYATPPDDEKTLSDLRSELASAKQREKEAAAELEPLKQEKADLEGKLAAAQQDFEDAKQAAETAAKDAAKEVADLKKQLADVKKSDS